MNRRAVPPHERAAERALDILIEVLEGARLAAGSAETALSRAGINPEHAKTALCAPGDVPTCELDDAINNAKDLRERVLAAWGRPVAMPWRAS